MCIAPIGILNACDPRQAVLDAYEVTQVIDSGVGQDAGAAIAAAVAAAFLTDATPDSVIAASVADLRRGSEIPPLMHRALELAKAGRDYLLFRERFYERYLQPYVSNDPRESVPVALALFWLASGDAVRAVRYGANFGRDADTIATMAGAVGGALHGGSALPQEWVRAVTSVNPVDQRQLAEDLCRVVLTTISTAEERAGEITRLR
jgi:ADP-ribosylglycohydrolase